MSGRSSACLVVVALVAALGQAGCLGGDDDQARTGTEPATTSAELPPPASGRPGLAAGLTEQNASLLWSAAARPELPGGFGPWRDRVAALRPAYARVLVDWAAVQPRAGVPPAWDARDTGCMRATPPCAPYAGMRERLRAIASQQQAVGGFEVVVVIYGTPDWAARPPGGCEAPGTEPRSRAPSSAALPAYRGLVRSLLDVAREEDVELRWWSPWNEPDSRVFLSPQRDRCSTEAPSVAVDAYATLARELRRTLQAAPGDQRIVLGDLLGTAESGPRATGAGEFARALPRDVVCAADVLAWHDYVRDIDVRRAVQGGGADAEDGGSAGGGGAEADGVTGGEAGGAGAGGDGGAGALLGDASQQTLTEEVLPALDARGCGELLPVWITETGVGGSDTPGSGVRDTSPATLQAGCRALHETLVRWWRSPRIQAAFQYSFREDDLFRYGLADTALTTTFPAYEVWRAWGADRAPDDPPPVLPASCGG